MPELDGGRRVIEKELHELPYTGKSADYYAGLVLVLYHVDFTLYVVNVPPGSSEFPFLRQKYHCDQIIKIDRGAFPEENEKKS